MDQYDHYTLIDKIMIRFFKTLNAFHNTVKNSRKALTI